MNNRDMLGGVALGAGLAFLFDPDRGARRRALLRDKGVRLSRTTRDVVEAVADASLRPADAGKGWGVIAAIADRCTEVDSGARNIDHILTHTLLPAVSTEVLERMADGREFHGVHVSVDEPSGSFVYKFL